MNNAINKFKNYVESLWYGFHMKIKSNFRFQQDNYKNGHNLDRWCR